MCGIAAIFKATDVPCEGAVVEAMRDEVLYRGPDDAGSAFFKRQNGNWLAVDGRGSDWQVGLGHRRLSILDLSQAGHQPMCYEERFWIIYNGEVYNFVEIRAELARIGYRFRSSTDTEVILAAYAEWGPQCFRRFRGMWGLLIFDTLQHRILLCRDRLGIKPLYLWQTPGMMAFASEIKQFRDVPGFRARVDPSAAAEYLATGYEDPGRSHFQDVRPVPAACWIPISLEDSRVLSPCGYWEPERIRPEFGQAEEAGRAFASKLEESVRLHLRSDVPVGCSLSGGLDSSSIAVIADRLNNGNGLPLQTFTCTFPGDEIDERVYVEAVLKKIRGSARFETPDPERFSNDLDRFLWVHDEPVGSMSMYAAYCVARVTREAGVPVLLSGQGGDELFGGYWQSYLVYLRGLVRCGRILTLLSHFAGALQRHGNPALVGQLPVMFRRYRARRRPQVRVHCRDLNGVAKLEPLKQMLDLDAQARRIYEIRSMFLPRLLKWDDRNSMAFSVEGRYPFLDHELIELGLSFHSETLYSDGWTKWPLRVGLRDQLPERILHRRTKFGFETPQTKWLAGTLRPQLERWLKCDRPAWDYLERNDVRKVADQVWRTSHPSEEGAQCLFRVFIFDRWLELFGVRSG
jgi:asparagine synthase (glutamine-hydrolysing)